LSVIGFLCDFNPLTDLPAPEMHSPPYIRTLSYTCADHENGAGAEKAMRKRHIKKAGKKLDAEMKAIVWPDLFQRPKVKITARERAAAKIKK
jgi:hypothetical protein